jgi:hypothetical protein
MTCYNSDRSPCIKNNSTHKAQHFYSDSTVDFHLSAQLHTISVHLAATHTAGNQNNNYHQNDIIGKLIIILYVFNFTYESIEIVLTIKCQLPGNHFLIFLHLVNGKIRF